jgi:hypothetical protein
MLMPTAGPTALRRAIPLALYPLALVTGVALGFLYNQVSRHHELAIIFPALVGVLGGVVVALVFRVARLPVARATVVAGVLAGGLAYASSFYFDYREFHANLVRATLTGATPSAAQVDRIEAQLLGSPGLLPYLSARADYGMGPQGRPAAASIHTTGVAAWALWTAQIALAAGVGGLAVRTPIRIRPSMRSAGTSWQRSHY